MTSRSSSPAHELSAGRNRALATVSPVETAEVDELIERYRSAESRIAANLVELDDHPTYALITSGVLTGASRARAEPLAAAASGMWTLLDALRRTLDDAEAARGDNRVRPGERLAAAEILTGPSVLVEVTDTPLAQRDLLAPGSMERRITIDALLDELRAAYEPLRDLVADIDAVWRAVLPRLDAAQTTLADLDTQLEVLGLPEPSVQRARARLDELRRTVMDDPLGVPGDAAAELDDAVLDAVRRVGDLRAGHDSLQSDLARTEALVAAARSSRSAAAAGRAETLAKIADPTGLVVVPAEAAIDRLAEEAAQLRTDAAGAQWHHVRVRLDPWLARAERLVEQLRSAEERNSSALERRQQLRGLLSAYKAKAAAIGRIELAAFTELADAAHAALYTAPTDLDRAAGIVARLGAMLGADPVHGSARPDPFDAAPASNVFGAPTSGRITRGADR